MADRADVIERLVQDGQLADTEPRAGDEGASNELALRSSRQVYTLVAYVRLVPRLVSAGEPAGAAPR